jgi:hypothetical protein
MVKKCLDIRRIACGLFGHNALRITALEQLFQEKFNHKQSKIHTSLDVKAAAGGIYCTSRYHWTVVAHLR